MYIAKDPTQPIFFGGDPGAGGAVASIGGAYRPIMYLADVAGYRRLIADIEGYKRIGWRVVCGLEALWVRSEEDPKKLHGVTKVLKSAGHIMLAYKLGGVDAKDIIEIAPPTWEYEYGLVGRTDKKSRACRIGERLYELDKVTLKEGDALLIADYLKNQHFGIRPVIEQNLIKELNITRIESRDKTPRRAGI